MKITEVDELFDPDDIQWNNFVNALRVGTIELRRMGRKMKITVEKLEQEFKLELEKQKNNIPSELD